MGISQKDPILSLAIVALCLVTIPIAIFAGFIILAPIIILGIVLWYGPKWYRQYQSRPTPIAQLQDMARRNAEFAKFPDTETYIRSVLKPFLMERRDNIPTLDLVIALEHVATNLYEAERFTDIPPGPPREADEITKARYRDQLLARVTRTQDPALLDTFTKALIGSFANLHTALPDLARTDVDHYEEGDAENKISIPLVDLLNDAGEMVLDTIRTFYDEKAIELGLFKDLRTTIDRNIKFASAQQTKAKDAEVLPPEFKGAPRELVRAYLQDTPFEELFYAPIPFDIKPLDPVRFQHHWIVAPPGSGKSTALQYLINRDLELVARDDASVIVIDSNRELVKAIEGLKQFAPGEPLHGKLLSIDIEDIDFPIALNLFDTAPDDAADYSTLDREALRNSILALYDYFFAGLLSADLTSRQNVLFNFTIQLLIEIPGATLDTLVELMQPGGIAKYAQYLDRLDDDSKTFFRVKFSEKSYDQTKSQVVDRLFAVKRIRALSRMFAAPKSKLNLYREMASSKVILINVPQNLLQEDGVEIVGRFFVAMILLAAQKRMLQPREQRKPTFLYIDECQDIIKRDTKNPIILDQARKLNVGVILAHQRLRQLESYVLDALYGATAIKFAAQVSDAAAHALARDMRCTPEFIQKQPKYHFAAFIRGMTDAAVSIAMPEIDMMKMPRMTSEEMQAIRDDTRTRYAILPDPPPPGAGSPVAPQQTTNGTDDPLVRLHHPDLPWKLEKDAEPGKPVEAAPKADDWRS